MIQLGQRRASQRKTKERKRRRAAALQKKCANLRAISGLLKYNLKRVPPRLLKQRCRLEMMNADAEPSLNCDDPALLYEQGKALLEQGQYEAALAVFDAVLQIAPRHPQAHAYRGIAHHQGQDYEAAIADFSKALQLDPALGFGYFHRALAHHWAGNLEASLDDYTRTLQLDPDNALTYYYRGEVSLTLQDMPAALGDFNQALRLDPAQAQVLLARGGLYQSESDLEAALADFSRAIQLQPGDASAYCRRGAAYCDCGQFLQAVADFDQAIHLDAGNEHAYHERAFAWENLGEDAKARADYEFLFTLSCEDNTMTQRNTAVYPLLRAYLGDAIDRLTINERLFPYRFRIEIQHAMETFTSGMTVHHLGGVQKRYPQEGLSFSDLLMPDRNNPALSIPLKYEEIDIGDAEPTRCLKTGLWLLEHEGRRFAVLLAPRNQYGCITDLQVEVALADEAGARLAQSLFKHLEQATLQARSYRGKIFAGASHEL